MSLLAALLTAVTAVQMPAAAEPILLHVSPQGNDAWSGRLSEPNADHSDGPLASLMGARNAIRRLRAVGGTEAAQAPVTVLIRGGTYRMTEPFVLEPEDSGTEGAPVVYTAAPGERPVFSGGVVIAGWTKAENGVWTAQVSEVLDRGWGFQQLFVNGQRRTRARTPNQGWFTIAGKAPPAVDPDTGQETSLERTAFVYHPGDIKAWPDLEEINVVVYHSWETSRLRIAGVDEDNHVVHFTGPACWPFEYWGPGQRYYVENVPEALDVPGEWYLDAKRGVVSYLPLPEEDMTTAEVVAPQLTRLVELRGDAALGMTVSHITLEGLAFCHQDWTLEPEGHSDPQAAVSVPAAVMADGASHCTIQRCEISHVGEYGLWLRRGCTYNRIVQCRIYDLGVGGVRIGEATMAQDDTDESHHNVVDNNHIYDGGHVYPAGVGIWVAQSSHNVISHNEIHDLNYSGMSIGWNWDDAPNRCHHNIIEYNHVHHVMRGQLSDGGAIYTLGTSPGSIIRNNVFHDVWPYHTPPLGWGIYLDATCNGYLVENNIVYNTLSGGLMYSNGGHEHTIQNNVFAYSAQYMLWPYWESRPSAFRRNIIYWTQGELFVPFTQNSLRDRLRLNQPLGEWDWNLYYNPNEPDLRFFSYRFPRWQALGLDIHSVVADPQFEDPERYDFRLKPTSPALALGFQPIDASTVGLYGDPEWVAEARAVVHPPTQLPPAEPLAKPTPVRDDFEGTLVRAKPSGAVVSGEEKGASIRVSDEQAASGRHSLKLTDVPGLEHSWEPHLFYQPHLTEGTIRQAFDIWLGEGALLFTEWRDSTNYPDCIGPSVTFDSLGQVTASGRVLTTVPLGEWVHVEIRCALGKEAPREYEVEITSPGEPTQRFEAIPYSGQDFQELHWLGFVSNATNSAEVYLDNVIVETVAP